MRVAFYTLGCKVNQYETSVMMRTFSAGGFDIAEPDCKADVYVVNSCTVTSTGDKKSRQALRRFRRMNPNAVVCLCGCFPQAFPELAKAIPEADIIMGQRNRAGLFDAVMRKLSGEEKIIDIAPHENGEKFESMKAGEFRARTRAFLKIQDGCERFCAYCVIPRARGPVRSKPLDEIISELEALAASGYREVVLAGINLSSYGFDIGLHLADAVSAACSVGGIARIRLSSLEPDLLTPEEIGLMSGMERLCPHFHLSLQSGCDKTLKSMRRHYNADGYAKIVESIRSSFKNPAITTDIMTGFPGESEEDHAESVAFAKSMGFARAHIFAYSKRPGTPAAEFSEQVENSVKTRRSREMSLEMDKCRDAFLRSQIGMSASVLLESEENGVWKGYSENYTSVEVGGANIAAGDIVRAGIAGVNGDACTGWVMGIEPRNLSI